MHKSHLHTMSGLEAKLILEVYLLTKKRLRYPHNCFHLRQLLCTIPSSSRLLDWWFLHDPKHSELLSNHDLKPYSVPNILELLITQEQEEHLPLKQYQHSHYTLHHLLHQPIYYLLRLLQQILFQNYFLLKHHAKCKYIPLKDNLQ